VYVYSRSGMRRDKGVKDWRYGVMKKTMIVIVAMDRRRMVPELVTVLASSWEVSTIASGGEYSVSRKLPGRLPSET